MGEGGRGEVSSSMSRMHKKNIAKTREKLIFGPNRACQIRNKGKHVMRPFKAFFCFAFSFLWDGGIKKGVFKPKQQRIKPSWFIQRQLKMEQNVRVATTKRVLMMLLLRISFSILTVEIFFKKNSAEFVTSKILRNGACLRWLVPWQIPRIEGDYSRVSKMFSGGGCYRLGCQKMFRARSEFEREVGCWRENLLNSVLCEGENKCCSPLISLKSWACSRKTRNSSRRTHLRFPSEITKGNRNFSWRTNAVVITWEEEEEERENGKRTLREV